MRSEELTDKSPAELALLRRGLTVYLRALELRLKFTQMGISSAMPALDEQTASILALREELHCLDERREAAGREVLS